MRTSLLIAVALVACGSGCKRGARDSNHDIEARVPAVPRTADRAPWGIDARPGHVAFADIDADGVQDLIIASAGEPLRVFRGDGRGGFDVPGMSVGTALESSSELAIGDHNRDGYPDVFVALHETEHIRLFFGGDGGRMAEAPFSPITVPSAPHLHSLDVGDVNGDGRLDLLTDSWEDDKVYVHHASGDSFAVARSGHKVSSQPRNNVRLVDVDGDGDLDIVAPASRVAGVTVLRGNGDGDFHVAPGSPVPTAAAPFFVAFPDLDGDGRREILVAHRGGSWSDSQYDDVTLLRPDDSGELFRDTSFRISVGRAPSQIAICDLDGDGSDDAVIANAASKNLTFVRGNRDGRVVDRTSAELPGSPFAIACASAHGTEPAYVAISTEDAERLIVLESAFPQAH